MSETRNSQPESSPSPPVGLTIGSWAVWALFVFNQISLVVVSLFVTPEPGEGEKTLIVTVLGGISFVLVCASIAVRFGARALIRKDPTNGLRIVLWVVVLLISHAMSTSIAVYGLVVYMLTIDRVLMLAFTIPAFLTLIVIGPFKRWLR